MAGKGGGAWKVAYADFVTAMMAFFMVMWLVGQKDSVKAGVAEYFREPPDPFAVFEGHDGARSSGGKKSKARNDKGASSTPGEQELRRTRGMKIRDSERSAVGTVVYFQELSDTLDDAAKKLLDELIPSLSGKPHKIEIRGHATRKPLPPDSPFTDAWQLCYLRSSAVMQYLHEHGIPLERMRLSQANGYEPLTAKFEAEFQAMNPRVEVYLLNEMAPGQPGSADSGSDGHGGGGHGAPEHGAGTDDEMAHGDAEHGTEEHGAQEHPADDHGKPSKAAAGKDKHAAPTKQEHGAKPAAKHAPAKEESGGHGGGHGEAKKPEPPKKKGPPPLYTPMKKREPAKPAAPEKKSGGHH